MFIMRLSASEIAEETWFKHGSMFGKMTDVNIWNYSMTVEEMKFWTNCSNDSGGGNVVNWETAEWTTWDLEEENIDKSEICQVKRPGLTIFPQRRTFKDSQELCQRLGGRMAVADSKKRVQEMMKLLVGNEDQFQVS